MLLSFVPPKRDFRFATTCPKERNQRKRQPQNDCSFLYLDIKKGTERKIKASENFRALYFLFAHALQLAPLRRGSDSNAYFIPSQQTRNKSLFPEIL
jgi:hypothetical protein